MKRPVYAFQRIQTSKKKNRASHKITICITQQGSYRVRAGVGGGEFSRAVHGWKK